LKINKELEKRILELEKETEQTIMNAKKEYFSNLRRIKEEMVIVKKEVTTTIERYKRTNGIVMICLLLYSCIITFFTSKNIGVFWNDFMICAKTCIRCIVFLIEFAVENLFKYQIDFNLSTVLHLCYGLGSSILVGVISFVIFSFVKMFMEIVKQPEWSIANIISMSLLCSLEEEITSYFPINLFLLHIFTIIPIAIFISKVYILPKTHIFSLISNFVEAEITKKL